MGDSTVKTTVIDSFSGEFAFLSNFHPSPITFHHPRFGERGAKTVEHAFQSLKTDDPLWVDRILWADKPGQAKRLGRKAPIRSNWEEIKIANMGILLRLKFKQNTDLRHALLATRNANLIEGNNWHDNFWGVCDCMGCYGGADGKNWLGKILMIVRMEEMRNG